MKTDGIRHCKYCKNKNRFTQNKVYCFAWASPMWLWFWCSLFEKEKQYED